MVVVSFFPLVVSTVAIFLMSQTILTHVGPSSRVVWDRVHVIVEIMEIKLFFF